MAISLNKEDGRGYTAGYWYLGGFNTERSTQTAYGTFYLYKSKEDRVAGKQSIDTVQANAAITGASTVSQIVSALETSAKATVLDGGTDTPD